MSSSKSPDKFYQSAYAQKLALDKKLTEYYRLSTAKETGPLRMAYDSLQMTLDGVGRMKAELAARKEQLALKSRIDNDLLVIKGTQPPMIQPAPKEQNAKGNSSYSSQQEAARKSKVLSVTPQRKVSKVNTEALASIGLDAKQQMEEQQLNGQPLRLKDGLGARLSSETDPSKLNLQGGLAQIAPQIGPPTYQQRPVDFLNSNFDLRHQGYDARLRQQQTLGISPEKRLDQAEALYRLNLGRKGTHMSEPTYEGEVPLLASSGKEYGAATAQERQRIRDEYISKSVDASSGHFESAARKYLNKRNNDDGLGAQEGVNFIYDRNLHNSSKVESNKAYFLSSINTNARGQSHGSGSFRGIGSSSGKKDLNLEQHQLWKSFVQAKGSEPNATIESIPQLKMVEGGDDIQLRAKQQQLVSQEIELPNQGQSTIEVLSSFGLMASQAENEPNKSMYDPRSKKYIYNRYKDLVKRDGNQRKFTFFGYNGNYPEVPLQALEKRGCWKILNYSEQSELIQKTQVRKSTNSKKRSTSSDKPNYIQVDEHLLDKCNFIWRPCNFYDAVQKKIDKRMLKLLSNEENPLVYNHYEHTKGIGTKSGLIRSLKQFYYTQQEAFNCGYSEFDTTPTTFILKSKTSDSQLEEFQLRFKQIQRGFAPRERLPMKHCVSNLWLVKPSNANQGRGIEIFNNMDQIMEFINSRPNGTHCVVQKYVERPLLYKGRKFDIRLWVAATTRNELYFYKDGYLRTSSNNYSLDNSNLTIHLTNQCLQNKFKDQYGAHEEGNTLSFDEFQSYLNSEAFFKSRPDGKPVDISIEKDLIPRMKDIVIDTFLAVKNRANPNRRRNHFELFGYDFLIDEDFRVWLIEVNTNPYLGAPSAYTKQLVPDMMDELFQIVLDPIYAPTDEYYEKYRTQKKVFELIYSEGQITNLDYTKRGVAFDIINQRRPYNPELCYPIPELQQQNINSIELKALRQKFRAGASDFKIFNSDFRTGVKDKGKFVSHNSANAAARKLSNRPISAVSKKEATATTAVSPQLVASSRKADSTNVSHSAMKKLNRDLEAIDEIIGKATTQVEESKKVQTQPRNYGVHAAQSVGTINPQQKTKKGKSQHQPRSSSRFDPFLSSHRKQQEEIFSNHSKKTRQKSAATRTQLKNQNRLHQETVTDQAAANVIKGHQDYLKASKKRQKELDQKTSASSPPNLSQKLQQLLQSGKLKPGEEGRATEGAATNADLSPVRSPTAKTTKGGEDLENLEVPNLEGGSNQPAEIFVNGQEQPQESPIRSSPPSPSQEAVPVTDVQHVGHSAFVNVPHLKLPLSDDEEKDEDIMVQEVVGEILNETDQQQTADWDPPAKPAPEVEDEYGLATPGPMTMNQQSPIAIEKASEFRLPQSVPESLENSPNRESNHALKKEIKQTQPKKYKLQRRSDFLTKKRRTVDHGSRIEEYNESSHKVLRKAQRLDRPNSSQHSYQATRSPPPYQSKKKGSLSERRRSCNTSQAASSRAQSAKGTRRFRPADRSRSNKRLTEEKSVLIEQYSPSQSPSPVKCQGQANQAHFSLLVKEQKFTVIKEKLDEFTKLTPLVRQRQSKLFLENLTTVAHKFFIEEFGHLTDEELEEILEGKKFDPLLLGTRAMLVQMIDAFSNFLASATSSPGLAQTNVERNPQEGRAAGVKSPQSIKANLMIVGFSPTSQYQMQQQPQQPGPSQSKGVKKLGRRNRSFSREGGQSAQDKAVAVSFLIVKPKCADIFLDLLLNDQLIKIHPLVSVCCKFLKILSDSIYSNTVPRRAGDILSSRVNEAPVRYNHISGMEELHQASQLVRDHLLKKPLLKKVQAVHQRVKQQPYSQVHQSEVYALEKVMVNLTSVGEARLNQFSQVLQKKSTFWRRHEKNYMVAGKAKGLSIPDEVKVFRSYEDAFVKCLNYGLIGYLCSNQCLPKTTSLFLQQALSKFDMEGQNAYFDQREKQITEPAESPAKDEALKIKSPAAAAVPKDSSAPEYLKCFESSIDFANLKSRMRLHYSQRFLQTEKQSPTEVRSQKTVSGQRKRKNSIQPQAQPEVVASIEESHLKSMEHFPAYDDSKPLSSDMAPSSKVEDGSIGKLEQHAQDDSGSKKEILITPKAKLMQRALKQQTVVSSHSKSKKVLSSRQDKGILEKSTQVLNDIMKKKTQPPNKASHRQQNSQSTSLQQSYSRNLSKPVKSILEGQPPGSSEKKQQHRIPVNNFQTDPSKQDPNMVSPIRQYLNSNPSSYAKNGRSTKKNLIQKHIVKESLKSPVIPTKKQVIVTQQKKPITRQRQYEDAIALAQLKLSSTDLTSKERITVTPGLSSGVVAHTKPSAPRLQFQVPGVVTADLKDLYQQHQSLHQNYVDLDQQKPSQQKYGKYINVDTAQRPQFNTGSNTAGRMHHRAGGSTTHNEDTRGSAAKNSSKILQRKLSSTRGNQAKMVDPNARPKGAYHINSQKQHQRLDKRLNLLKKAEIQTRAQTRSEQKTGVVASPFKRKIQNQTEAITSVLRDQDGNPLEEAMKKLDNMQTKLESQFQTICQEEKPSQPVQQQVAKASRLSEITPAQVVMAPEDIGLIGPSPKDQGPCCEVLPVVIDQTENIIESQEETIALVPTAIRKVNSLI